MTAALNQKPGPHPDIRQDNVENMDNRRQTHKRVMCQAWHITRLWVWRRLSIFSTLSCRMSGCGPGFWFKAAVMDYSKNLFRWYLENQRAFPIGRTRCFDWRRWTTACCRRSPGRWTQNSGWTTRASADARVVHPEFCVHLPGLLRQQAVVHLLQSKHLVLPMGNARWFSKYHRNKFFE